MYGKNKDENKINFWVISFKEYILSFPNVYSSESSHTNENMIQKKKDIRCSKKMFTTK